MIRIFSHYLHKQTLLQVFFDLGLIVFAVIAVVLSQGLHVVSCGKQHCHWGIAGANGLAGRCLSLDMRR